MSEKEQQPEFGVWQAGTSVGILDHLLEVEKKANVVIEAAQTEATSKITAARTESDAKFKLEFSKINKTLEADFEEKKVALAEKSKKEFEDFKERISVSVKDENAFNGFLEKVFFV